MQVHLIDGTYELFRHYYALPKVRDSKGQEVAAVRGVLASLMGMLGNGVTHMGVATDHVIESFRNGLWPGYKTSEGVEPDLLAQFPLLEETLVAAGVVVPMPTLPPVSNRAEGSRLQGEVNLVTWLATAVPSLVRLAQAVSGKAAGTACGLDPETPAGPA